MATDLRFYRPNKEHKGNASSVELRYKEKSKEWMLFFVATKQTGLDEKGNASFGWKTKEDNVVIKLGTPDVGELMAVLNGKKDFVGQKSEQGLFHKNESGNSSLQFAKVEGGYKLRVSSKTGDKLNQFTQMLSFGDGEQLKVVLQLFLTRVYG